MAIVKTNGAAALQKPGESQVQARTGTTKSVAQRAVKKSAVKKAAAKKSAGRKKEPAKQTGTVSRQQITDHDVVLDAAYHSLNRAGAVISLLDAESGEDLRALLGDGIELYRDAIAGTGTQAHNALCASGLLRAAEHLAMAGLYSARRDYRTDVTTPHLLQLHRSLDTLDQRLAKLRRPEERRAHRLLEMARELLRRSTEMKDDPHLRYELVMAAEAICSALESGLGV